MDSFFGINMETEVIDRLNAKFDSLDKMIMKKKKYELFKKLSTLGLEAEAMLDGQLQTSLYKIQLV